MQFARPLLGLVTLIGGVSLILIMYLLKQQYKQQQVPSLLLWEKVLVQTKAQKPWQKLRKSLLLLLQLLAAILLALAVSGAHLTGGHMAKQYVLALDCSLSMQAEDVGKSRFENAKADIDALLAQAPPTSSFSLVLLTDQPSLAASSATPTRLKRLLEDVTPTAGSVDWDTAKNLLSAEQAATEGEIVLYTDDYGKLSELPMIQQVYNGNAENTAITTLSHRVEGDGLYVLVNLHHYGDTPDNRTITLYADGAAFDTQEVSIDANTDESVVFSGIPTDTKSLEARLSAGDALSADDARYEGLSTNSKAKVLLVGDGNIFLEKALTITGQCDLYQAKTVEEEALSGYKLYIFDGVLPDTLPTDGHIMILQPPTGNPLMTVGETQKFPSVVRGNAQSGIPESENISFALNEGTPLSADWGRTLLQSEGQTLALYGERNAQKIVAFGFDFQESDFPLQAGFPILFYHLLDWYFPESAAGLTQALSGDMITFSLHPSTTNATVRTAEGTEIVIAPPHPAKALTQTAKTGLYTLTETDGQGQSTQTPFGINAKTEGESDLALHADVADAQAQPHTVRAGYALAPWALLLLLVVLLIEWQVNCREN